MGLDIEKVAMLTSMVDKLIQMKRVDNALDESVVEDLIQKSLFMEEQIFRRILRECPRMNSLKK